MPGRSWYLSHGTSRRILIKGCGLLIFLGSSLFAGDLPAPSLERFGRKTASEWATLLKQRDDPRHSSVSRDAFQALIILAMPSTSNTPKPPPPRAPAPPQPREPRPLPDLLDPHDKKTDEPKPKPKPPPPPPKADPPPVYPWPPA